MTVKQLLRRASRGIAYLTGGLFVSVLVILGLSQTSFVPPFFRLPHLHPLDKADTRTGQWEQDIDYLTAQLLRLHIQPAAYISPQDFQAEAEALKMRVPDLDDRQLYAELNRLVAMLGDSHTGVTLHEDVQILPVQFRVFADGIFITGISADVPGDLQGAQVLAVNDIPIESVQQQMAPYIAYENTFWLQQQVAVRMRLTDFLYGAGIISTPNTVQLRVQTLDGTSQTVSLDAMSLAELRQDDNTIQSIFEDSAYNVLAERHPEKLYWMEFLSEERTLYIQYDRCAQMDDLSFVEFVAQVERTIQTESVEKLIVDVRENSGGASSIIQPLIDLIVDTPTLNREGYLFVLVGRRSYSSTMHNINDFLTRTNAIFVGVPTGGRPSSPGETRSFIRLPNHAFTFTYSTRRFDRIPGYKEAETFTPDIIAPRLFRDYLDGNDAAVQTIPGL